MMDEKKVNPRDRRIILKIEAKMRKGLAQFVGKPITPELFNKISWLVNAIVESYKPQMVATPRAVDADGSIYEFDGFDVRYAGNDVSIEAKWKRLDPFEI